MEYLNRRKPDYKRYLACTLSFIAIFGNGPVMVNGSDKNVENSVYEELNAKNLEQLQIYKSIVLENFKNSVLIYPNQIDFSNIPMPDGSVETAIDIVDSIRMAVNHVPNFVKYQYAVSRYFSDSSQLDELIAVIKSEARYENYIDAFGCMTVIGNRTISNSRCNSVRYFIDKEGSITLYDHVVCPYQFETYENGLYLDVLGENSGEVYQAVIDFLYTLDYVPSMHPYLNFVGSFRRRANSVQFVSNGNRYYEVLSLEDTIPLEERYYYLKTEENNNVRRYLPTIDLRGNL